MTDLPVWLQGIRDRANKATPGPWTAEDANPHKPHKRFAFYIPEIMSAPSMPQYDGLTEEDAASIAHSRADVPRLVELVGEMAWNLRNVTDQVQDACRSRMTPLSQCPEPSDDYCPTCPTGLRGECGAPRSLEALRKFRGEVSSND
jgi:hypothetical protein